MKTLHRFAQRWVIIIVMSMVVALLLAAPRSGSAQTLPTATPDANGVIYAQVQPNDSLWSIAARAGISLQALLELNNLTEDALIQPGDLLIIGISTPAPTPTAPTPTSTAVPTRLPPTPAPTRTPPHTGICLLAFLDTNENGRRDDGERLQTAVAFTIFDAQTVVANYVTDGLSEPHCIEGLPPGTYQVTRSVRRDETLTTAGDRGIILQEGDVITLEFGSDTVRQTAVGATTPAATAAEPNGSRPRLILWLITGGFLLIAAILFMMVRWQNRKTI